MDREPGSFISDKKGKLQPNPDDEAMVARSTNQTEAAQEVITDADK